MISVFYISFINIHYKLNITFFMLQNKEQLKHKKWFKNKKCTIKLILQI